jgi:hypothetical protein
MQSFWIPDGKVVGATLRDTVGTKGSYPSYLKFFEGELVVTNVRPKIPICPCFGETMAPPTSVLAATAT